MILTDLSAIRIAVVDSGSSVALHIGEDTVLLSTAAEARALLGCVGRAMVYLGEVEARDAELRDREAASAMNALRFGENVAYGTLPQPYPPITSAPAPALQAVPDGAA